MPTLRYVVADVFTDRPLEGNQLAVFTDARAIDEETMQALALEIGFSETTFVLPPEQGGTVRIRIFTPKSELPFAGHPCLGTAWVLAMSLQRGVIELETKSGVVPVELEREGSGKIVFGRMSQPLPSVEPYPEPEALLQALHVEKSQLPVERYDNGLRHALVLLDSQDDVAALRPDFAALTDLEVMVSCFAGSGAAWKTRVFAPGTGYPKTRRRARRPGRSSFTSADMVLSSGESGSRSRRVSRSDDLRRSSRGRMRGTGSSSTFP